MSFTTGLIKTAINCTPNFMMLWVANIILKDIAELSDLNFDLDIRTVYVQATLNGEAEPIEVWLDGFSIFSEGESKYLILNQGRSNRAWLNTIFSRIAGKTWKIPAFPQYQMYIDLAAELLRTENQEQEEN